MLDAEGWSDTFPLLPHPAELLFGSFGALVGLLPLLGVGAILLVWLRTRRPRVPTSTVQAVAAAGHDPARAPERPVGQWNARVTPQGKLPILGEGGQIRIDNGWLGFHFEGAEQPSWIVPTTHVRAGKNSLLAQSEVWIETPTTGRLNVTVSHEHINLLMDNDFKDLRERRYADEFLWLLHQSGAQLVAG